MPGDYEHDVFFSYKRHDLMLDWNRQVTNRLRFWLTQELGREASMFVDETHIEAGDRWPDKLREALRLSRCMVCVWTPPYFNSDWCVSEWKSFLARERRAGMQAHGLIAPLKIHDGEHFPPEAKEVQWEDVSLYTATVPAFWSSVRALELEDRIKSFAVSVAKIIGNAPPFEADWPVVDALGTPFPNIGLAKL